jgi:serine/threonine protein phosphatase PrpC
MKFAIFQESRIGKRKVNQDRMNYSFTRDALLMVVADGMGGHLHGEVAAQITVQTITETFKNLARTTLSDPFLFLSRTLSQSHLAINKHAGENGLADAPRTTCIVCIIQNNIAYWAHVGDSRLYAIRDGQVLAQTRDHSHVKLLIEQGLIDEAAAAVHPSRNLVYSCLGGPNPPEIEFSRKTQLQSGDVIALCTDGAWAPFIDDTLVRTLATCTPMDAVPRLLDQAEKNAGSHCDNLTLMAMQWESAFADPSSQDVSKQAMPRPMPAREVEANDSTTVAAMVAGAGNGRPPQPAE